MTAVLALEVVADHVTVQHAKSGATASANALLPALGIRFLDLPAVVIDAPNGQCFPAAEGCIPFDGRGKALLFELPQTIVQESTHVPLPLWLTVLARPQHAVSSEQAFLVGTACLDMRAQALCAAVGRPSTLDSPVPYQSCAVGMTSARGIRDALQLQCRLRLFRVYDDDRMRNGIAPGETRLEHQAVIVSDQQPKVSHATAPVDRASVEDAAHTASLVAVSNATAPVDGRRLELRANAASVGVQVTGVQTASTQTDDYPASPGPSPSGIHTGPRVATSNAWEDLAAAVEEHKPSSVHLPGEVHVGRVHFPEEVHVLPVAPGAAPINLATTALPQPCPAPIAAAATNAPQLASNKESSLSLIAKLTQELCQLQGVALGERE